MAVLEDVERQALLDADQSLSKLQESLEEAASAGAIDDEAIERMTRTAREAAGRVNDHLPPMIDPQARDEIRRRLIDVLTLDVEGLPSLDIADHLLVEMEAVRHVVRDILQEQPAIDVRDAAQVIALLEEWLQDATVIQRAELLGLSERQVQRKRKDGGVASRRQQLVIQLVAILRHAWTDQGVVAWFLRERTDLGDDRPIDLLDDASREREIVLAARAGRVQGAA
ncbi:MAG TPA: hypothetical protein VEX36_11725 [Thermoleophilaceae bacterium]|nr:hypothetical protein [Thermoleophilaceae bacterium]